MTTDAVTFIEKQLNDIIDELHPLFKPISDEELVDGYSDHGIFERSFLHQNGKKFLMRWRVYYGTPDTVRTVFEPATELTS
jgi:hypothetical protein